jgi:hypothetical protein
MRCHLVVQPTEQGHPSRDQHGHELTGEAEGKIKEIADYCDTDIVPYRVWLQTARHRKRYLMPAARINLSFELSSAVTYMSISAGVIGIGLIASCFSLCCIAGVASTLVAVEWNFSTIARAV